MRLGVGLFENMGSIFDKIVGNIVPWYNQSGGLKHKLVGRKEIAVPESLKDAKVFDDACQGYLPDTDRTVKCFFWRPELHHICVTLVLDDLLAKYGEGDLFLVLDERDTKVENYINLGTVEMISSGIKYSGSFRYGFYDVMKLTVKALKKDEITVPSNLLWGFEWYKSDDMGQNLKLDIVPVSVFGGKTILNFAVCGEFNLSMFFSSPSHTSLIPVFSKSFCCK